MGEVVCSSQTEGTKKVVFVGGVAEWSIAPPWKGGDVITRP